MTHENKGRHLSKVTKSGGAKIPSSISLNDMKNATAVLSHGCVKELRKLVTCSEFSNMDDADDFEDPQIAPENNFEEKAVAEEPLKDAQSEKDKLIEEYVNSPKFEIKNIQTAALVITKGCTQELSKLVTCSEFKVADVDDEDTPGDKGHKATANRPYSDVKADPNIVLSENILRRVKAIKYLAREDSSSTERETEQETLANSIRKNKHKTVSAKSTDPNGAHSRDSAKQDTNNDSASIGVSTKTANPEIQVEIHADDEKSDCRYETENEQKVNSKKQRPIMRYEPARKSYRSMQALMEEKMANLSPEKRAVKGERRGRLGSEGDKRKTVVTKREKSDSKIAAERAHRNSLPPLPSAERKEVSVEDMLSIVTGMLNEVSGSLDRLNKCIENSASMNCTPLQSPVPMRRKYKLLHQIKRGQDFKEASSSLPRNFYARLKESENNDCGSLFSQKLSSDEDHSSCGDYGMQQCHDNLRIVVLKRRMHEKYPKCFPDDPAQGPVTQNGISEVNIVAFESNSDDTGTDDGSHLARDEYYARYIMAPRSVERFTEIGDSGSNFYEIID